MHSILGWLTPKAALSEAVELLRRLPIDYVSHNAEIGPIGWYMDIQGPSENAPTRTRGPGIYATAFAVRLLCATQNPAEANKKYAIAGGVRYLFAQIAEAETVASGRAPQGTSKQAQKYMQLGFTDNDLVLKIAQSLEAFNSLRSIKEPGDVLSVVLSETRTGAQDLVEKLQESIIEREVQGVRQQCWGWHRIPNQRREPHVVPTAQAACALLRYDPTYRGLDVQRVVHYLNDELKRDFTAILPLRATAYNCIVEIEQLTKKPATRMAPAIADFLQDVDAVRANIDDVNWQEVLFYHLPASETAVTHHKPWIWYSPKLELLRTWLANSEYKRIQVGIDAALALATRARRENGYVRFYRTSPPNWVTIFEVSRLLSVASEHLDGSKMQLVAALRAIRSVAARLLQNYPAVAWGFILFGIWSAATQVGWFSYTPAPDRTSAFVIQQAAYTVYAFWPIALMTLIGYMIIGEGTIRTRLMKAALTVLTTVVIGVLVSVGAN